MVLALIVHSATANSVVVRYFCGKNYFAVGCFAFKFGSNASTFSELMTNICPVALLRIGFFPSINDPLTASAIVLSFA